MKKILFVLLLALAISGCSKYGYVSLHYPTAPQAYLPDDVNSIAVVNRSLIKEEEKNDRIIEAVASSEVAGSDRLASDECIKGAYDAVKEMEGTRLIIPQKVRLYGTGTREMPELLDWNLVAEICKSEGCDALLVLETFDSNTDLLLTTATEQLSALISTGSPKSSAPGEIKMNVVCDWRLYHPGSRTIVDQYRHSSYMSFNTSAGLPPPTALPETAYDAGIAYIQRFLLGFYVVKRDLYKRTGGSAKKSFKAAYRRAEVANWQGAIDIWNEFSDDHKQKTAGRACLNIAVANEVLGNTDFALDWAKKSYEYYNDKLGRDYSKILLRRKRIEE
jgi:Family of unknown function (DUF6340)/Prokaryotic membrane lipoprotein lipid attachment site